MLKSLTSFRLKLGFKRLSKNIKKLNPDAKGRELQNFLFSKKGALICPWQFEEELIQLVALYENLKSKNTLEIGTANGGTLFLHARLADKNATVISIDLPEGRFGGGYPAWKIPLYKSFAHSTQKIELIRASSHEQTTIDQVTNILKGTELDYLFIDGDHTYEGVKKDFDIYKKFVKDGGVIVFHDIVEHDGSSCQVDKFWEEIKLQYPHKEFIKQPREHMFGIGVIYYKK